MRPAVSYIPCAEYSKEKTGGIIMFAQFEEGDLLSETRENSESDDESSDESDYNSTIP